MSTGYVLQQYPQYEFPDFSVFECVIQNFISSIIPWGRKGIGPLNLLFERQITLYSGALVLKATNLQPSELERLFCKLFQNWIVWQFRFAHYTHVYTLITRYAHNILLTLIRCRPYNVMDVVWTLKQCCVPTYYRHLSYTRIFQKKTVGVSFYNCWTGLP